MEKEQVTTTTIDKLVPDDKNFNKGTEYGKQLLGKSFAQFGAGRSILLDKNNRIIAGNKATEEYGEQGGEKVIVVETDGTTLVAVKRTDIDLDSKRGRELALADNATQKADLEWATEVVEAVSKEWEIDAKAWGVEVPDELGEHEDISAKVNPLYQISIECEDEMEQERIYNELKDKYRCRVLTL